MNLTHPTTITFVVYLLAMIGLGFAAWRATHTLSDYILGGRRLGSLVTALSVGASDMSGWLLMGLPGAVYGVGLAESWIAVGLILGAWFNWSLVAGRLRVYTELAHNALTLPGLYEMVPGFGLACLAIVAFSLFDRAPAPGVTATFSRMLAAIRATTPGAHAGVRSRTVGATLGLDGARPPEPASRQNRSREIGTTAPGTG